MKCVHGGQVWTCPECYRIMREPAWPTWIFGYNLDGKQFDMYVVARDEEEAKRRLSTCATWGKLEGRLVATVPVSRGGFLVPLIVWFRNLFRRTGRQH